jgi:hypothetical protein
VSGLYVKDLHTGKEYTVNGRQSIIIGGNPPSADFIMNADTMALLRATLRSTTDGNVVLDVDDPRSNVWVINEAGEKRKILGIERFSGKVKFSIGEEGTYVFEAVFSEYIVNNQESNVQTSNASGGGSGPGAFLGFLAGIPISYFFQGAGVKKLSLVQYVKALPGVLRVLGEPHGWDMVGDAVLTVVFTCVVCAFLGGLLWRLLEQGNKGA